jgi:hypothetical protein
MTALIKEDKVCECRLCETGRAFQDAMTRVVEEDRAFWENLANRMMHAEADADYWEAVAKRQWPGSERKLTSWERLLKEEGV